MSYRGVSKSTKDEVINIKGCKMSDSGILQQAIKIEKVHRMQSSHFVLCNGDKIRYLIAINGGKKRLSSNISTYSSKLGLLMKLLNYLPFAVLKKMKLGDYVKATLHPTIEEEAQKLHPDAWNLIVGTYDEKQKLVMQCYSKNNPLATFIKIGNETTQKEMQAEIDFLKMKHTYRSFTIPVILASKKKSVDCPFNLQITREFVGGKVKPELTIDIVKIYREIAAQTKLIDGVEREFSHGDFAPWNIKKNGNQYIVFDWEHCGYRVKGFDLMHYATIIEMVIHGKSLENAFAEGLKNINKIEPDFIINKEEFLNEFEHLRKQIM